MFTETKVTQLAAFFLGQNCPKPMPRSQLMALLYLADRESVRATGWPISDDQLMSTRKGPILSTTAKLMEAGGESRHGAWPAWVETRNDQIVSLRRPFNTLELDEISPVELDILATIQHQFGAMDSMEIRSWMLDHCDELRESSLLDHPVQWKVLARAVGYGEVAAAGLAEQIREQNKIESVFATL